MLKKSIKNYVFIFLVINQIKYKNKIIRINLFNNQKIK